MLATTEVHFSPSAAGIVLIISESPGSVMDMAQTLKYLPQAVPNSTLFPV